MKLSFSTLGCPGWSWHDMLSTAKDLGFDGIEVRGIEDELYVPKALPFIDSNLEDTKRKLKGLGLEIPCLTSASYLYDKGSRNIQIETAKEYIDLAKKLGTPYVRVLGDREPQPSIDIDMEYVMNNLIELLPYAKDKNVKLLLETNGVFANSKIMLSLIKALNSEFIGVLWDVHHPYRFYNEPVNLTYNNLKPYIEFIHIKDSVLEDNNVKYKIMGQGDVPVREVLLTLKKNDYPGYISLEWVKRWCVDLEEPGIVFSKFVNYVRDII
ncbi:MAG: sugar phosphate isomerase/epimerase family protein [Clostridia bacterium]|jgi:fatty-acyl-CoA synthase